MLRRLPKRQQQGNNRETRKKLIWIEHKDVKNGETKLSVVSVETIFDIMPKEKSKVKEGIGKKVPVSKMKFCTTLKKFGMSNVAFF